MIHVETLFEPAIAEEMAANLNADPEDDWNYQVKHDPAATGGSLIGIYESNGAFVGNL